jgi:DNA polymerase
VTSLPVQYLFADFETFNLLDLTVVGLDRYAKHPSLGISMLGWAADDEEIQLWLPHLGPAPKRLLKLLHDPKIIIVAWHSIFEQQILKYGMKIDLPTERFRDPIVLAHALSLPGYLEDVADILKMPHRKDERGEALKDMFCQPVSMGGNMTLFGIAPPLFRDHNTHPREFEEYGEYCKRDTRAERDLWYRLLKIQFPEHEWRGWFLDQKINQFGIPTRRDLAEKGLRLALRFLGEQQTLLKEKTGLENPNSDPQMKEWVHARGYTLESLRAPTIRVELDKPDSLITPECREVLDIRLSTRKSSYTKIEKMLELISDDDRIRYQFRYLGASRTGRWASGGGEDASVQVQNLSRGEKAVRKKLELALDLLEREDYDGIVREFTNVKNKKDSVTVVSFVITLMRSLFQAKPGNRFVVADKNAIENRMLGWAAGCDAMLDVFRHSKKDGGDPYLSYGTKLTKKTYAELWADYAAGNEDDRQKFKAATLAAGFGQGGGEMKMNEYGDPTRGGLWGYALSTCGVDMTKEEAQEAVDIFRSAYPEVVQFWSDLEEAFKQVLMRGGVIKVGEATWNRWQQKWLPHPKGGKQCVIAFRRRSLIGGGYLIVMELPSGRALHYLNPKLEEVTLVSKKTGRPFQVLNISYDGVEHSSTTGADGRVQKKHNKWGRVKTYGGKLCENAIQAMARDDLLHSIKLADNRGFHIWGLFHDEIACEEPESGLRLDALIETVVDVPKWAPGLILGAEGWEGPVYHK